MITDCGVCLLCIPTDRTNRLPISKIELYTRYTTVLWSTCNEWEVKVPPPSGWPTGCKLPGDPVRSKFLKHHSPNGATARVSMELSNNNGDEIAAKVSISSFVLRMGLMRCPTLGCGRAEV